MNRLLKFKKVTILLTCVVLSSGIFGFDSLTTAKGATPTLTIGSWHKDTVPALNSISEQGKLPNNDHALVEPLYSTQTNIKDEGSASLTTVVPESVTDHVYIQEEKLSQLKTLKLLNEVEQIRKQKQMIKSPGAVKEIIEKRTANSKHYLMKDGSYQAIISFEDQHFEDENGQLQDIVPFLIDESQINLLSGQLSKESAGELNQLNLISKQRNGKFSDQNSYFRAPQVPFDVKLPKIFSKGYSIEKEGNQLTFIPQGANSVIGSVYEVNKIQYDNAWNQTDVIMTVNNSQLKEDIVVRGSDAPTTFTFEVVGNLAPDLSAGSLHLAPMWLMDANGVVENLKQDVRIVDNHTFLDITYNPSSLTYPIIIDPTVNVTASEYGSYGMERNYYWSHMMVGNYIHPDDDFGDRFHTLLNFDISSIRNKPNITSVILNMKTNNLGEGPITGLQASRITSTFSEAKNKDTFKKTTVNASPEVLLKQDRFEPISFDLTAMFKEMISNNYAFNGIEIAAARTKFVSERQFIELLREINIVAVYNENPSAPQIITPNGGEIVDSNYLITWIAGNDSETTQSNLQYQAQYSIDGGYSWRDIVSLTKPGITSIAFDFTSVETTTKALVRVRTFDGGVYSNWGQSKAPFTIQHNRSPNAPLNPSPGNTSASPALVGLTPTLKWTFSDPDAGDKQSGYRVTVFNTAGTLVFDSSWQTGSAMTYTIPSGKLARGTTYYWRVETKDSKGAGSPTSAPLYIKVNSLPVLTLTSYTNGQTVPDNILRFNWNYSDADGQAQSAFQILGSKDNFSTIAYNSGVVSGAAKTFTTPPLSNGTWRFRVLASDGLEWSVYSERTGLVLPNAYEPNDTLATATPAMYGTYSTYINSSTDVDYFSFKAGTKGINRVELVPPAGKNYDITIYDSSKNILAAGIRESGASENVIFEVTPGSTYYVKVNGVNGDFSSSNTYTLTISNVTLKTETQYQYDNNGNMYKKTTIITP